MPDQQSSLFSSALAAAMVVGTLGFAIPAIATPAMYPLRKTVAEMA